MSRLIDVNEAIKDFEKYDSFMGEPLTERDAYLIECVLTLFGSQPTAYDVEAVVRELKELHIRNSKGVLVAEVYNNAINDAIEIVKRGGLNE